MVTARVLVCVINILGWQRPRPFTDVFAMAIRGQGPQTARFRPFIARSPNNRQKHRSLDN